MERMYFFILLIFVLLGGILVGWIIFKRKYRSDSYVSYPVKPVDATDLEKPSIEIAPGIEIFQYERFPEKIKLGQSIDLPKEKYRTFEPIFYAIPTGALAYDSATKWILKFSPERLHKGLIQGYIISNLLLMEFRQWQGMLKAGLLSMGD
jgi:hypothetical protein